MYYGNSTGGFDADDPAPSHILECPGCCGEIEYYNDDAYVVSFHITIEPFEFLECDECGREFAPGTRLKVLDA